MIYSVNLKKLTKKINPFSFAKYLKDTGWTQFQTKRTYIKVFQNTKLNGDFFQVTIPMEQSLSDYQEAMYTAIETVAFVEGQSAEQLLLFLLNPNTDILKIRLDRSDVEAGNILFDDAIRIYENAKKLIAATAQDILHPKKYHQGRCDDAISQFIGNCKFGQTEIGSYVVSVVCPFAELDESERYKQLSIFSEEDQCADSLTRKVTNRIMSNVSFIKRTIDDGDYSKLSDSDNISANFYDALSGLNLNQDNTNLEFIAQWSPAVKKNRAGCDRIMLSSSYYEPISAATSQLRESVSTKTKILGRIKKLESCPDPEKRNTGKITIVYLNDADKPHTITANLNKADYEKAIEAHGHGNHVEIIGDITNSGKRNASITCESFAVLD